MTDATAHRHLAVLRLRLPDGRVLPRQFLTLDADGRLLDYRDITGEIPFCPYLKKEVILEPSGPSEPLNRAKPLEPLNQGEAP